MFLKLCSDDIMGKDLDEKQTKLFLKGTADFYFVHYSRAVMILSSFSEF